MIPPPLNCSQSKCALQNAEEEKVKIDAVQCSRDYLTCEAVCKWENSWQKAPSHALSAGWIFMSALLGPRILTSTKTQKLVLQNTSTWPRLNLKPNQTLHTFFRAKTAPNPPQVYAPPPIHAPGASAVALMARNTLNLVMLAWPLLVSLNVHGFWLHSKRLGMPQFQSK